MNYPSMQSVRVWHGNHACSITQTLIKFLWLASGPCYKHNYYIGLYTLHAAVSLDGDQTLVWPCEAMLLLIMLQVASIQNLKHAC